MAERPLTALERQCLLAIAEQRSPYKTGGRYMPRFVTAAVRRLSGRKLIESNETDADGAWQLSATGRAEVAPQAGKGGGT